MATVSKELADRIIASNGYFPGDPRVMQVVEYLNFVGEIAYAILYIEDVASNRYAESPYVNRPRVIWRAT